MPAPVDPYQLLAQYFSRPVQAAAPGASDIAKKILLSAQTNKPLGPGMVSGGATDTGPSLTGRIFDILSRPNYAVAEFARDWAETGSPHAGAAWEGFSGHKKTTWAKSLKQMGMTDPGDQASVGLFLDIVADPTTFIPVGGIANKIKAVRGADKAAETAAKLEKPLGQRLLDQGTPINPENFNLPPSAGQTIPQSMRPPVGDLNIPRQIGDITPTTGTLDKLPSLQEQLPLDLTGLKKGTKLRSPKDIAAAQSNALDVVPPVGPAKEVPGQIPFKFPDFSVKSVRADTKKTAELAAKLTESAPAQVAKVSAGDIQAALKLAPTPPPVISPKSQAAADLITSRFDPTKATAQINKQFPDTLNAQQQAKLWYSAREMANKSVYRKGRSADKVSAAVDKVATEIYHAAEQKFVSQGLVPRIGTGENVALSDVIKHMEQQGKPLTSDMVKEFSTAIKPGSDVWKAVETMRARGAITDSKSVQMINEAIAETKAQTEAAGQLSDGQLKDFDSFLKNFGQATARAEGVSPAGIKSIRSVIDETLKLGKSPAQIALEQNSKMLDDIIATGKANPKVNGILTRALEKDLGVIPKWAVNDNKAVESFMGRMATWWGQKDLRPLSLNAIGSAQATAAARGQVLDNLFKPFGELERSDALKLAQGFGTSTSAEVSGLATQIKKMMDNLVGQVSGSSVLLRSGVNMQSLNKWMRHYNVGFEFTNGAKAKDLLGATVDYSKGTDWLNSWKSAQIEGDPKVFLFKMQQAMEQATREKALFDELGERFGSTFPGKEYRTKIEGKYRYIDGYYFPADIAKQIPRVIRDWSIPAWQGNNSALKLYDRVLSMWKSGVTIYRPGHHVRNIIGDVYLGWMDGVNSSRPYVLAAKVQRGMHGIYTDMANVDKLVEIGALPKTYATPKPNEILFRNKSGTAFTAEQIGAVAHQKGLLEHAQTIEDIIDMGNQGKNVLNMKPFGGKVQGAARGMSEMLSHNSRLAHFIDKVIKSTGQDLPKIFESAAQRARKWHPTGLDLTPFEKKVLRRALPFYSWIRKSTPLLIEGMVMNPGKAVVPAKVMTALQTNAGIEGTTRDNPFPVDQMFPSWIRESGVGPVALPTSMLSGLTNQQPAGYTVAGIGVNPLQSLLTQLQSPVNTIATSMTPGVQVPIEMMTGRKLFTGEPITGPDSRPGALEQYVGEQIPLYNPIQAVTGMTPFGTQTKGAVKSGSGASTEAITNWLSGLGIKGTGPYVSQAKFEKNAPIQMQRKVNKEQFLNQLRQQQQGG